MPLSEHEQRLLEQMEQQLLSDDPRFASTMRGPRTLPAARRRLVLGVVGVVVGVGLLVLAVFVPKLTIWLTIAAFAVMFGGVLYAMSASSVRGRGPHGVVDADGRTARAVRPAAGSHRSRPATRSAPRRGGGRRGTFMQRLEQRWDRRRDERWT